MLWQRHCPWSSREAHIKQMCRQRFRGACRCMMLCDALTVRKRSAWHDASGSAQMCDDAFRGVLLCAAMALSLQVRKT
eukprot:1159500-Pelagomonas_calceolata.AAC.29